MILRSNQVTLVNSFFFSQYFNNFVLQLDEAPPEIAKVRAPIRRSRKSSSPCQNSLRRSRTSGGLSPNRSLDSSIARE